VIWCFKEYFPGDVIENADSFLRRVFTMSLYSGIGDSAHPLHTTRHFVVAVGLGYF
jgi:hypothetical protein